MTSSTGSLSLLERCYFPTSGVFSYVEPLPHTYCHVVKGLHARSRGIPEPGRLSPGALLEGWKNQPGRARPREVCLWVRTEVSGHLYRRPFILSALAD